ncbi:uncharacterized protein OCT59_025327 [Rhizophagus irregularis]|uniref:Kelch-like protein 17 n=1 Tax=Rhizophagus irregularis (strain DAOM 197198w) TaxID=1432141 RepID=A0A015JIH8_RHIIW|nr:hypothetical protein RirG_118880 [Rhizophagus irregularis DAOM 197198w]UZO04966.1 hypothetical protein OCT59_025327 [Rhizophagus irregularis]
MSTQFFSKLSQNYIELLEDSEYYDITIEVGEDPNVKIFRAHMNILCYRSPYLRRTLSSNKKNDNGVLSHIKLPNISPEIFQIILRYIYGGILPLNGLEASNILNTLVVADELNLQELINYLQNYLIENNSEWLEQHFELVHRKSIQSKYLSELQQFCTNLMAKSPEKIFKSFDFTSLPEKSLVSLIKKDDLQMREIEVWEHVLKWGLAQNQTLTQNPDTWSDDDFKTMKNVLQNCLPLIRFFCLSSKELRQKVRPYQKLLNQQLYEDLIDSYMDPDNISIDNILPPRNIKIDKIIDSKIVNLDIVSAISRWVDKIDMNYSNKFANIRKLYLPYKFKLLLRGSRDGFTPKKFHELCDGKSNTITLFKVKENEEIIGGYNPLKWESKGGWVTTKDSFIFSFINKNIKDAIISNVENTNYAFNNYLTQGPYFGKDIIIYSSADQLDYERIHCRRQYYEKKIRDSEDYFSIEDYEVFQAVTR